MNSLCRIFCLKSNKYFLRKTHVLNSEFSFYYSSVLSKPDSKMADFLNISSLDKSRRIRQCNYKLILQNNIQTMCSVHQYPQKIDDDKQSGKNRVLVYEAPLKTRVKIVKLLSLSSSVVGFAVFPSVIVDIWKVNSIMACAVGAVSLFFLSTPFMLNWITRRYVLDLYFDTESKTFTAKTFNLMCLIKETTFKASDVEVPELPGMLSSITVKGRPLFVDASMIKDPDAYSHMMGYDIPLDITLNVSQKNENVTNVDHQNNESRKKLD